MRQRGTLVIAHLTFKEAARRRILIAALLLGIVFLTVYGLGIHFIQQDMMKRGEHLQRVLAVPIYNFLAQSGLYVVSFLTLALTVLTSVDTISGEIDSGSIQAVAAKPIRRWEILIGKWLGFVGMLTLYLLLMAGGVLVLTRALLGYSVPNALRGLALMWINELLLLNVTLLGGTRLSTLANGVLAFSAYGVAFIGGWIEQIGAFLGNQTTVVIGILSSLLMPSEALWKRAAFEMQTALAEAVAPNPFMSSLSVPSMAMVIYAVFYAALALALAVWSFRQRDL
ncbi:MAG: ABC transporter permease [Anaerolineae bacterium]|jgi:ABC-type transport system involved in multi-copper enzyme maturation permease subunit